MAPSERSATSFAVASGGSIDFGHLPAMSDFPDRRWPAAPVRLERGSLRHGLVHIEAKHGATIAARGYSTVEAFVEVVLRAREDVLLDTRSGNVLVVHRRGGVKLAALALKLAATGAYYTVVTAYPVGQTDRFDATRKRYRKLVPE